MNEQKIVYKCFKVVKSCETCRWFILDNSYFPSLHKDCGTCRVEESKKVKVSDDCEKWDFDENLFDDTFWIVKPNITGSVL